MSRTTSLQTRFIQACLTTSQSLDEIMDDLQIDSRLLARWLEQQLFRRRLRNLLRMMRQRCDLDIQIGAMRAAGMLNRAASGTLGDIRELRRSACVDLIKLARDAWSRDRTARAESRSLSRAQFQRDLHHPNLRVDEVTRLVRSMDQPPTEPDTAA